MSSYRDLQTCRVPDGPIPWTAAQEYGRECGLDAEARKVLWCVVHAMDRAERKWVADNRKPGVTRDMQEG